MLAFSIPLFGVIYAIAAATYFLLGATARGGKTAQAVGGVLVVVAALNAYVENPAIGRIVRFPYATIVLTLGFALAYTILCLRLMEQIGARNRRVGFHFSYLPLAYACLLGVALFSLSPRMPKPDDPALAVYVWITFSFALHVPLFAAGKSQAAKVEGALQGTSVPATRAAYLSWVCGSLGLLMLPVTITYMWTRVDWRLFALNATVTSLLLLLCIIGRPPR